MSIRHLNLHQGTDVVDPSTDTKGVFFGWTDTGKALIWWDGFDGAEEENPDASRWHLQRDDNGDLIYVREGW